MKIIHRVGLDITDERRATLKSLGVKLFPEIQMPGGGSLRSAFDIVEDHPNWPQVQRLLQQWGLSSFVRTEFSKKEIHAARWLEIGAWHHGYPEPSGDFGYLNVSYDLSSACEKCEFGKKQKAAFRMRGEPRWGKKSIMQLIWLYEEMFVTPELWSKVFEPRGIGCRSVENTRGVELKTVVQLVIEERVSIRTEGLVYEVCEKCGRKNYRWVSRGKFPALVSEPRGVMVRTNEHFGSGGEANQAILVAQDIVRALEAEKETKVWYQVLAEQ